MDDNIKRQRTWFVRVFPLWVLPWSWKGWLWTVVCMAVALASGAYGGRLADAGDPASGYWQMGFGVIIVIFLIVAFRNSSKY